ncbi:MAG: hypothetical protein H6741_03360 [Alphaproteobacteria bacterium]|nr:hypothetical protein [Alphaproteobacteria bacterium]
MSRDEEPKEPSPEAAEEEGERRERRERPPRIPGLRTARRLVAEAGGEGLKEAREVTRDVVVALLDSSDRVKTETVRMIGREVRTYLEGLGLKDDVHNLLTNYSLEVHASVSLKPLADAVEAADEGRKRRKDEKDAE